MSQSIICNVIENIVINISSNSGIEETIKQILCERFEAKSLASLEGFEPPTRCLEGNCPLFLHSGSDPGKPAASTVRVKPVKQLLLFCSSNWPPFTLFIFDII